MKKQTRNLILIGAISLMFLSVVWIWLGRVSVEMLDVNGIVEGGPAPDFSATMADGNPVSLDDYSGKVLVLNFWASWCVPCQQEMPTFEEIFIETDAEKIEFLMMNVTNSDTQAKAERFVKAREFTFPVAFDLDNSASTAYQVNSYPITYVIGTEGQVCQRTVGIMNEAMVRVAIEECVQESVQ